MVNRLFWIPKLKITTLFLCYFLIGWVCVGCQSQPKHPNIFENPVCEPPCWENITPDVTIKQNVINTLSTLSIIDQPITESHAGMLAGVDSFVRFTLYGDPYLSGQIDFVDDKVSTITLGGSTGLSLQQAIEKFGVPQSVYVDREGEYTAVTFLLPQSGIVFDYTTWAQKRFPPWADAPSWTYSEIRPEVEINFISYFAPNQYKSLLDSGELTIGGFPGPNVLEKRLYPWNGYGSMNKYLPPSNP